MSLLNEWYNARKNYAPFVDDGIFDSETFNAQKNKILFVLKEADWKNGIPGQRENLCSTLLNKDGGSWKSWNNIARWSKAILDNGEYPENISCEERHNTLCRIAAINLKKEAGGAYANGKSLIKFAIDDAEFLKRQIDEIAPNIIICCGYSRPKSNAEILYENVLFPNNKPEWQYIPTTQNNVWFFEYQNIPVVSFYHPMCIKGQKGIRGHELFKLRFLQMKEIADYFRAKAKIN